MISLSHSGENSVVQENCTISLQMSWVRFSCYCWVHFFSTKMSTFRTVTNFPTDVDI